VAHVENKAPILASAGICFSFFSLSPSILAPCPTIFQTIPLASLVFFFYFVSDLLVDICFISNNL
jgi:hypothetical protein